MGYIKRNKTGDYNAGTKLIIPGKGIQTAKKPQGNKKSDYENYLWLFGGRR